MKPARLFLAAAILMAVSPVQAADLPAIATCNYMCNGSKLLAYNTKAGDDCLTLWKKLNFESMQQMIKVNKGKTNFSCMHNPAPGTLVCYPRVKSPKNDKC